LADATSSASTRAVLSAVSAGAPLAEALASLGHEAKALSPPAAAGLLEAAPPPRRPRVAGFVLEALRPERPRPRIEGSPAGSFMAGALVLVTLPLVGSRLYAEPVGAAPLVLGSASALMAVALGGVGLFLRSRRLGKLTHAGRALSGGAVAEPALPMAVDATRLLRWLAAAEAAGLGAADLLRPASGIRLRGRSARRLAEAASACAPLEGARRWAADGARELEPLLAGLPDEDDGAPALRRASWVLEHAAGHGRSTRWIGVVGLAFAVLAVQAAAWAVMMSVATLGARP
jgi:hypothetical protein